MTIVRLIESNNCSYSSKENVTSVIIVVEYTVSETLTAQQ